MISRKSVSLIVIASLAMGSAVFAASTKNRLASTVTSATVNGIDSGVSSGSTVAQPGNEVVAMPPVRPPFRPPIRSPFTP